MVRWTSNGLRARLPRPEELCRGSGSGLGGPWLDCATHARWVSAWLRRYSRHSLLDIDIEVDLPWDETRRYEYSDVYFATDTAPKFAHARHALFRLKTRAGRQRVRVLLPESVSNARRLSARIDPFPTSSTGRFRVQALRLVAPDDADCDATEQAELMALKQRVRAAVVESERTGAAECRHLPESMTIELTARCNLTCGHCSSHGTPELHRRHNKMTSMDPEMLRRLTDEVFPGASGVTLVGRGEPLMADDASWAVVIAALRRYGVLMRFVTNGTLLRRRLTSDVMPLIDMVTVSFDGNSDETMRANRGVRMSQVLDGVRHYHELRVAAGLARRPRLGLSWTLKRNNIHELPDFIERMAEFEPDNFFSRHLLVYFDKDKHESLVGDPALTNRYLGPAHDALHRLGIRSDCPPLMSEATPAIVDAAETPITITPKPRAVARERDACPYVHRTGVVNVTGNVPMCSAPFVNQAGTLAGGTRFADIWNGDVMTGVRAAMNTPQEWTSCRSCWYREVHYASQRAAAHDHELYDLESPGRFTEEAWDFRRQRK